jgi:mono/diheme cytochrome c family protein
MLEALSAWRRSPVSEARLAGFVVVVLIAALSTAHQALSSESDRGETLFQAQCGDCHGARDIAYWTRQRPDATEREAWLDRFLERHYPPPEDEKQAIIDYILAAED